MALTRVQMLFVNRSGGMQEGTYLFPLPADASISSLTMWADGQRMTGEILDKDKARQIYESIVRQRRDPALLQYVGSKAVELRVFPIPPNGERKIELEYSLVLKKDAGLVRYVYPLAGTSFPGQTLKELSISLRINAAGSLKNIYSPSHDVSVTRRGDQSADVGFEAGNVTPSKDFELFYSVDDKDVGLSLLTYKSGKLGDKGYFLLLVSPRPDISRTEIVARDVILVVDVSGSMGGIKIQQAGEALKFILGHLNAEDRFNVVSFSSGVDMFSPSLRPISDKDKALDYVSGLRAAGSTNIYDALQAAVSLASPERQAVVIFLTDGQPTVGVTDDKQILAALDKGPRDSLRLFVFGIGDDVNASLLDRLAEKGHGLSQYVRRDDQVLPVVASFYEKIGAPVLVDLKLDFGPVQVEDVYPRPLPDLYVGSQLTIVGRYRQSGDATLAVEGRSYGKTLRVTYPKLSFAEKSDEATFIPRLWATRKIGYLLDQVRLNGQNREVVEEIRALSVEFGIMTPYTSYFIQENVPMPLPGPMARDGFPMPAPTPAPMFQGSPLQQGAPGKMGPDGAGGGSAAAGVAPAMPAPPAGQIDQSQQAQRLKESRRGDTGLAPQTRAVADKTFVYRDGRWVDSAFKEGMSSVKVVFGSPEYFRLLEQHPEWGRYFSVSDNMVVVLDGKAYVVSEGEGSQSGQTAVQNPGGQVQTPPVAVQGPDVKVAGPLPWQSVGQATPGAGQVSAPHQPDAPVGQDTPNVFVRIWNWLKHAFTR